MRRKKIQQEEYIPLDRDDLKHALEVPVKEIPESEIIKIEKPGKKGRRKIELKNRNVREEEINQPEEEMKGTYTLIITEKPQAALKIATALGNARKLNEGNVSYYELTRENKKILIAAAVGHLFTLTTKEKGFPVFNISWQAEFKKNTWAKKYYLLLKKVVKNANEFIIATDYDVEGEVIGWNIIRFIGKQKDAKRMKFSTLTSKELEDSYKNLQETINWGQAIAGETRHFLDWMYGINLSRALMSAIQKAGSFRIMSIGRVQGPALNLIVQKELEIQKFKPEPYWQIFIKLKGHKPELKYEKDITKKSELDKFKNLEGKKGTAKTEKFQRKIIPPFPFDLTSLQREAYRLFGINPSLTLQLAQNLYLAGLISYPRTSSQKIPFSINPKSILKKLAEKFKEVKFIKREKPVEGKKSDPAHPSIYPTGEFSTMNKEEEKIYSLIVKRFISCFCEDAEIEDKKIVFETEKDKLRFKASGLEIINKGWMNVYPLLMKEVEIETIEGEKTIEKSKIEEKITQPPRRYTPASIITELEKRNLGTKCLTGNTKILYNGKFIEIEKIFNSGKKISQENNIKTRQIDGQTISLNKENNLIATNPNLISKRRIGKNEKIIKIATDSSDIKLTDEHLVYIFRNNKIEQIPAKNLSINDKVVGIAKNYQEGEIVISKDFFEGFKIRDNEIIHKFSQKTSRGIRLFKLPVRWSTQLAWILGYYYGDGSYSDKKYNGSHQIYFTTTEDKALNLLKSGIRQIFGNEPYCYNLKRKYKVNCNAVMSYALIKKFPNLKGKKPIQIPTEFTGDFLRGFFDADGNVHLRPLGKTKINGKECNSFDTPRIKITLSSEELIKWVSNLLDKLGIHNHINKGTATCKGKKFNCWTILISGKEKVERFAYKVGFDSYKEGILYKGLKCNSPFYEVLRNSARIYLALNKKELKPEELAEKIGISRYSVMRAIKHLFVIGIISKRRIGNRSKQKWVYSIKEKDVEYETYCIKLVYKKIGKDLYEIPVREIKEEHYDGYVYDISVGENSPNFITEGSLLVHNSTRANIVETLYNRNYIKDTSISATPLGIKLIASLEKYSPIIIDEKLTRHFEKEMNEIQTAKKNLEEKEEKTIKEAKETITKISEDMKKNEEKIGKELIEANQEIYKQERENNTLQICEKCKKGNLRILFNKKFRRSFVACSNYPECKTTFSLPPGLIKPSGKTCEFCGFPKLLRIQKGRRPWEFCFNPNCPSRNQNGPAKKNNNY